MADEEPDAVTEGSDGEVVGGREDAVEVSDNEAGSEHEDSGIVAAEPADGEGSQEGPDDAKGTGEEKREQNDDDDPSSEDGGDGAETNDVVEGDADSPSSDHEQNAVLTPPKFGDFLLRNSTSERSGETGSDEEASQDNSLVFEGDEPADESDSSAPAGSKVTEITADEEDKDRNGVEHVTSEGKSGEEKTVGDKSGLELTEDDGGEVEEVIGDSDSVVVSQSDSTEAPQESQEEEEEDKEVEDIMANCKSKDKADDSDSDIEMVEEIKKTDDDDDDDIQEVIDDDDEGATASLASRAPRRKTQARGQFKFFSILFHSC